MADDGWAARNGPVPLAREFDLDRCSSGSIGTLSFVGTCEGPVPSSPGGGMPMPESLAGNGGWGAIREDKLVGGFGAGLLGIRFRSFAGRGPGPFNGTGGGARGFSKLPS